MMKGTGTLLLIGLLVFTAVHESSAQSKKKKLTKTEVKEDPFFSTDLSDPDEIKMVQNVKLLDQFIHRFNLTQNIKGERMDLSDSTLQVQRQDPAFDKRYRQLRRHMLSKLTDTEKEWGEDTLLIRKMREFVIENDVRINLTDQKWCAVVTGSVEVDGSLDTLNLVMQVVPIHGNAATWKILSASASFLQADTENELTYIQPLAHESNFIDLAQTFNSGRAFNQVLATDGITSELLNLQLLVAEKRIKYLSTADLVFQFFHYPDHVFEVSNVKRDTGNTGWLITKIQPKSKPTRLVKVH